MVVKTIVGRAVPVLFRSRVLPLPTAITSQLPPAGSNGSLRPVSTYKKSGEPSGFDGKGIRRSISQSGKRAASLLPIKAGLDLLPAEKKACCEGYSNGVGHSLDCTRNSSTSSKNPARQGRTGQKQPRTAREALNDPEQEVAQQNAAWEPPKLTHLLENNKKWVQWKLDKDPDFFKKLSAGHHPDYLFIGCSDARLSVQNMLGLELGQLFVHRNIANVVVNTDMNFLSVLTYAVDFLKVKDIIVCGHYDCGGVRAALQNTDHGLIANWVMGIRDVARLHREELRALDNDEAIYRRLVELNVQESVTKLYANPVVQKSQSQTGGPHIHAFVYDVADGYLKELSVDFKPILQENRHIYSMYSVPAAGADDSNVTEKASPSANGGAGVSPLTFAQIPEAEPAK